MKERGPTLAAVIGHPVAHSLSPLIFSVLSSREKIRVDYHRVEVPPGDFAAFIKVSRKLGLFMGWNVTIPHKQAAARHCDHLSPEADATGAVNVVRFDHRKASGFNTDIFGVERTLAERHIRVRGTRALVFGAGGAALAVGYALARQGAREVIFTNRALSRARGAARKLARIFKGTSFRALAWGASAPEAELYVNATSLGLGGSNEHPPFPRSTRRGAVAFDVVYIPEDTAFLREARKRGLRAVGGLDMLIWQAIATWEIWFGKLGAGRARTHKTALESALRSELARRKRATKRIR